MYNNACICTGLFINTGRDNWCQAHCIINKNISDKRKTDQILETNKTD